MSKNSLLNKNQGDCVVLWLIFWPSQCRGPRFDPWSTNAGDVRDGGLISGSGSSPGEGNSNPLQYFCLENLMDRRAWQAIVHRVAKSQTQLKRLTHTHTHTHREPHDVTKDPECHN